MQGLYEPFRRNLNLFFNRSIAEQIPATAVIAGAASGVVGGA